MRYSIYVNNYLGFSEFRMGNRFRFISDDFDSLTVIYPDDRPSKVLTSDKDIVNKFRQRVFKGVIKYAQENIL